MSALSSLNLSLWDRVDGWLYNAAYGTLSPAQKQALVAQQTAEVTQAGGDPTTAATQAQTDVTAVLTQNGADPSQASILSPGLAGLLDKAGWAVAVVAVVLFVFFVYRAYEAFR